MSSSHFSKQHTKVLAQVFLARRLEKMAVETRKPSPTELVFLFATLQPNFFRNKLLVSVRGTEDGAERKKKKSPLKSAEKSQVNKIQSPFSLLFSRHCRLHVCKKDKIKKDEMRKNNNKEEEKNSRTERKK